jgi:hypothetical protein
MNTPEIQSPEFPDTPLDFLPDDELPETVLSLLRLCIADAGPGIIRSAEIFNEWAEQNLDRPPCSVISEKGVDEPIVGGFEARLRGVAVPSGAGAYPLWVLQRGLDW